MVEAVRINIDDIALVRHCQRGDLKAIERLILKYQNRIYNLILRICANHEDAADLTQETFLRVIEKINSFQGRSSFYTWLFRIAVNLTLSHCKKTVKLGYTSIDAGQDEGSDKTRNALKNLLQDENAINPAEIAADKEFIDLIIKAMMKLEDDHRMVIVLREIEGMEYSQMAEVLNVELGTVKSRLSRARANLREIMEVFLQ